MNRTEFRAILTLLTVLVLLLGNSLAATGSPPTMPISTSPPAGQGPYLYLTNYTFDPLLEATPSSLPTNLKLSSYPTSDPGYYLLQFHGPIQSTWKEAIITAGAQIYDYIPDFAFVVKMDQTAKAAVEALDAVRWVGLYQPGYRVAPQLMYTPLAAEAAETVDLTVVVFKGENMAALAEQLLDLVGIGDDVADRDGGNGEGDLGTVGCGSGVAPASRRRWRAVDCTSSDCRTTCLASAAVTTPSSCASLRVHSTATPTTCMFSSPWCRRR